MVLWMTDPTTLFNSTAVDQSVSSKIDRQRSVHFDDSSDDAIQEPVTAYADVTIGGFEFREDKATVADSALADNTPGGTISDGVLPAYFLNALVPHESALNMDLGPCRSSFQLAYELSKEPRNDWWAARVEPELRAVWEANENKASPISVSCRSTLCQVSGIREPEGDLALHWQGVVEQFRASDVAVEFSRIQPVAAGGNGPLLYAWLLVSRGNESTQAEIDACHYPGNVVAVGAVESNGS